MNKGILAVVLAVVVGLGVFIGIKVSKKEGGAVTSKIEKSVTDIFKPSRGSIAIPDVIPEDTIFFMSAKNVQSTWNLVSNSGFWSNISKLSIWEQAQVGNNWAIFTEQFQKNTGMEFNEETLMGIFGHDVSIVLLGSRGGPPNPQLLIYSQLDSKSDAEAKLNKLMSSVQQGLTIESVDYNGYKITRIRNTQAPGPEFNISFIKNLLVMSVGLDDSGVRQVIDLAQNKTKASLSKNTIYQDAISTLKVRGDLRGLFFINMISIVDLIKAFPTVPGAGANFTKSLEQGLGSIQSIAGAVGFDSGMLIKLFFMKNPNQETKGTAALPWDSPPSKADSIKLLPEESILFTVSNSLDLSNIWQTWQQGIQSGDPSQAAAVMEGITSFENETGINIEQDILSWLGDELTLALLDIDMSGLFPFPQLAIIAKVKDQSQADTSMQKIINYAIKVSQPAGVTTAQEEGASTQMSLGEEDYKGTQLRFVTIQLPYQSISPCYAFVDKFIVVGINKASVKAIIDVMGGERASITKNKIYRTSTSGFSDKVNQMAFLNLDRALGLIIQITTWANNLQKATGNAAAVSEQAIRENVLPILESLKVIKSVAVEAINRERGIEETLFIQIEDIKGD